MVAPSTALNRGELHATHSAVPSHSFYMVGHTALGAQQRHLIPLPSLHGGEGSSFQGYVPPDDTGNSKSVVGVKPHDSGVVIGYHIDEYTLIWSAGHSIAQSHI